MNNRYLVTYSRILGGTKDKRIELTLGMPEKDLKSLLCDNESRFQYIVKSAKLIEKDNKS